MKIHDTTIIIVAVFIVSQMLTFQTLQILNEEMDNKTRPDTRPIPVADGWAGAEMRVFTLFDSCSRTDQQTDGRTDGRTKALIELRVRN